MPKRMAMLIPFVWTALLSWAAEDGELPSGATVIAPQLMKTKWFQGKPFNDFMPVDMPVITIAKDEYNRGRMPCGCVATGLAQIIRYFEWPVRTDRTDAFEHNWKNGREKGATVTGKVVHQHDGHVPFEWAAMADEVPPNASDRRGKDPELGRYALARLCLWAGVLAKMDYGTKDSGAYLYDGAEALGEWYEEPTAAYFDTDYAGAKAATIACLKEGVPVAVSLGGHQEVIHGWAECDGEDWVCVATDKIFGMDGWYPVKDEDGNCPFIYATIGLKPKKTVQLDPLRKVEDSSVELRWTLPNVWTDAVAGFTAKAVASGEQDRTLSVGKNARSCVFSGLTAGKAYAFTVTPIVAGAVESPAVTATIADANRRALPWPEIKDVWSTATNKFGETWYHENATGKGVVYVRCSKSVKSLEVISGNLTALPQDKIVVRSFGGGLFAVALDGANVAAMPSSAGTSSMSRLRMIATLAARDENGTSVYKNLSLRFSSETPQEDVQELVPDDNDEPVPEPTVVDGEFVGTVAKNADGEYVVTPMDGVFAVLLENVGTNTVVVPPGVSQVGGVPPAQLKVKYGPYDIGGAFTFRHDADNGFVTIALDGARSVRVVGEDIPLRPTLADATNAVPPFAMKPDVAVCVKAIPGLTYHLVRAEDPDDVENGMCVTNAVAVGPRVRLVDADRPPGKAFYIIRVTTGGY